MWLYQGQEFTEDMIEDYVGFVYLIVNLTNQRKYLGKKLFKFMKTKKVKGRKRRYKTDSDWKEYWGSNKVLLEDIKQLGEEYFSREILHLCKSKGTANYLELKEQILHEALESDQYYNDQIHVRIHRSHIKLCKSA